MAISGVNPATVERRSGSRLGWWKATWVGRVSLPTGKGPTGRGGTHWKGLDPSPQKKLNVSLEKAFW